MSYHAGSLLLFLGYVVLTVKRLAGDWFNPGRTTESVRAHQMMLASMTLCIYFFIGVPLLFMFDKWEIMPIFGAFYFVAMSVLEMMTSARLAGRR